MTDEGEQIPISAQGHSAAEVPGTSSRAWKIVSLFAFIAAMVVLARVFGLGERLVEVRRWIGSLGPWGPVVFVFVYALAVVAAVPGSALTIASGALFGSTFGVLVVSIGSTIGASLSFLIARYVARDAVVGWLSKNDTFHHLDQLSKQRGAFIVALTRLVPIFPFNLLNYGFGLTSIPFRTYLFWSWLCMLPGTALFVMGGDALTRGLVQMAVPWRLILIMTVAAILVVFLGRYARGQFQVPHPKRRTDEHVQN